MKNKGVWCHKAKKVYFMHTLNIIVLNTNVEATYSHYCDLWSHLISIPIIIILMFPFQVPVPVFLYISRSELKI